VGHHHLVHHVERGQQRAFVIVRQRAAALFVPPEHLRRGEGNRQMAAERAGFAKELEVASVDNVIAAGDEDTNHGKSG